MRECSKRDRGRQKRWLVEGNKQNMWMMNDLKLHAEEEIWRDKNALKTREAFCLSPFLLISSPNFTRISHFLHAAVRRRPASRAAELMFLALLPLNSRERNREIYKKSSSYIYSVTKKKWIWKQDTKQILVLCCKKGFLSTKSFRFLKQVQCQIERIHVKTF